MGVEIGILLIKPVSNISSNMSYKKLHFSTLISGIEMFVNKQKVSKGDTMIELMLVIASAANIPMTN